MNKEELYELLQSRYRKRTSIHTRTLPEIDLYMDQVTTFMEDKLKLQRRHPEDKILTKTMINNYTKNRLLPPPTKKKYNQNHLLTLIYTYYLKSILTISDIKTLLSPMIEKYWGGESSPEEALTMKDIYERILTLEPDTMARAWEDVSLKMDSVDEMFRDDPISENDKEYLEKLALCLQLSFDVYMKKQMLEEIIDDMKES